MAILELFLAIYLSQNRGSDGHFELLNGSESWLVQNLWPLIYMEASHMLTLRFFIKFVSRYLAQILINQLSDPENKKCSPWKVFGKNHPQILLLLSRRGPRSPEARLSQHYIGPKMTFQHFSNFCRKKFPGLIKGISCTYWMNVEVLPHDFCKLQPPKLYKNVQEPFCQAWKLFSGEIWKMLECHFWANVMLR